MVYPKTSAQSIWARIISLPRLRRKRTNYFLLVAIPNAIGLITFPETFANSYLRM